jgi:hypothetical protein
MSTYRVPDKVRQFLSPVREFSLHNATDEPILIMFCGETRIIPACDQVTYPHPKFDDVCHSAKDADGDWIPGSLVIRDMVRMYLNNQEGDVWSAANAIKHALEIDVSSGEATGKYAQRGVSMLPPTPTKEQVAHIAAAGRRRYEAWRVQWAREICQGYEGRIAALKASGHAPIPLGPDYDRARAILEVAGQAEKSKYTGLTLPQPPVQPIYQPVPVEEESVSTEELAEMLAEKFKALVPSGQGEAPDVRSLVEQVINSPAAMKLLKTKYKVRKLRVREEPVAN